VPREKKRENEKKGERKERERREKGERKEEGKREERRRKMGPLAASSRASSGRER